MSEQITTIRLDAWIDGADAKGGTASGVSGEVVDPAGWALRSLDSFTPQFLAPVVADPRNWRDAEVGWGVVMRDGVKVPQPLADLIAARGQAPVFYYLPGSSVEFTVLRNYKEKKDIAIEGSPSGLAPDALPTYLLIYGSPAEVPWRLQYVLNTTRCVGRLHLTGAALQNYVNALLQWDAGKELTGSSAAQSGNALVWAVDQGDGDITRLMRDAIAEPLASKLKSDGQLTVRFVDGTNEPATGAALVDALGSKWPGLIVTTSHGRTGPLDDPEKMMASLGFPVDANGATVTPAMLLGGGWQPSGAVWYAHACCSAGSAASSSLADLFAKGTTAATVLDSIAKLGSTVSPLPTALLGAERPLRAFIGHVEPTFDWTLQQVATGQFLTSGLIDALYTRLYVAAGGVAPSPASPIGYAFRAWYGRTAGVSAQWRQAMNKFNRGEDVDNQLLATALTARDLESTVILGDPTVAIAPLV